MNKRIVLGSGKLYAVPFVSEIPADAELETDENLLGLIQGGATLSYSPTFYTAQDDFGIAVKKMLTEETATLSSGILTWNGETIAKLVSTAVVDDSQEGKRVVKIGGTGNYEDKKYVLRFVHEDTKDGDIRVTIIGQNEAGFEIAFAKDQETVVNAEFSAFPSDDEGTLIIYEEEVKA